MALTMFFAFSALIQLYAAHFSIATEPVCSKFSYEEKLLEKMIRTEIKVETMQNEIKKTEETVLSTLVEIKKTALDIQDKFEGFRNDLTTKIVAQMQAKEEQNSNQFEELTNNITVKMENERDILAKLRESIIQPSIAFHVHNAKDLVLNTNKEVLVFESIITNEGSGYDKSTGIFTAPIEGAYFFTVHVCTAKDKYTPIGLVFDSLFVARSINHDKDYYTCGSVSAIIKMKSGGQVWVASTQGNRDYVLNAEDMYRMNTFSGVLLSKHK